MAQKYDWWDQAKSAYSFILHMADELDDHQLSKMLDGWLSRLLALASTRKVKGYRSRREWLLDEGLEELFNESFDDTINGFSADQMNLRRLSRICRLRRLTCGIVQARYGTIANLDTEIDYESYKEYVAETEAMCEEIEDDGDDAPAD
jgi:hypothetical protein